MSHLPSSSQPLVSIIIAVRNGDRYLSQALDSIFKQDYRHFEVIVIDGHSSDQTVAIAQSFQKFLQPLYCFGQTGEGLAAAWNQGIELAQGQLIAFVDSDDLWSPQKLSLQVKFLQQNDQIDYTIGHFRFFLEEGCAIPVGFKAQLLNQDLIGRIPGTLLIDRSMFDKVGQFNPNLKIASDVDWFSRCQDAKLVSGVLPEVILFKRVHEANLSAQAQLNNQELLKVLRKSVNRQRL